MLARSQRFLIGLLLFVFGGVHSRKACDKRCIQPSPTVSRSLCSTADYLIAVIVWSWAVTVVEVLTRQEPCKLIKPKIKTTSICLLYLPLFISKNDVNIHQYNFFALSSNSDPHMDLVRFATQFFIANLTLMDSVPGTSFGIAFFLA